MTHANAITELHEIGQYEHRLNQARTIDPEDDKQCEALVELVDQDCTAGIISSDMAQRIITCLCERRSHYDL